MAVQGSLKTIRIPELFSLLHQLRKTGILHVVSEREERGFLFYRGNLVYATAKEGTKRLGYFLVRLGVLSIEDLAGKDGAEAGNDLYFGQRLIEQKRVSQDDLNAAVKEQILDILEEVLTWGIGAFHFDDNDLPFAIPDGVHVTTQSILFEATRRADERNFIKSLFPDICVVLAKGTTAESEQLTQDEVKVMALVDGQRSVEQILFARPLDPHASAGILHTLLERKLIERVAVQVSPGTDPPVPELYCLPVAPNAPGQIFHVFNQEDSLIPRITAVLEQDPLLVAKALRVLTLAGTEIPRLNLSVGHIVRTLGSFRLRSILVPEAIRGIFYPNAQCTWKELWEHSLICAQLCRQISGWIDYPCPEEAYLGGLLHNLGIFLLMSNNPPRYQKTIQEARMSRVNIEKAEEEAFGISHTRIGGIHAEKWKFPRPLILAIRHHHRVEENVSHPLVSMVAVAIGLAEENGVGIEPSFSGPIQYESALGSLHLNRKKVASLIHRVPRPLLLGARA